MIRSAGLHQRSKGLSCRAGAGTLYPVPAVRPQLERLEDRLSPTASSVGVAINITPNLATFTATETIRATVTQQGSNTPVTSGIVAFTVNSQQGTAALNGNGQAILAVNLPLSAVAFNQTLDVLFEGTGNAAASSFVAPVYLNFWNAVLPSQLSYGPPATNQATATPFLGSAGGESDALFLLGIPVVAHYVDPGFVDSVGFNLYQFPI